MVDFTMVSTILDGIPNEVALQCLARVPFVSHPVLQLVCRSWRASVCNGELFNVRKQIGVTEELLCVLAFEPENVWQLYDPLRDKWITLPVMPSQIRNIARFGVASVAGKLYVIGGGSDRVDPLTGDHDTIFASNEVWSYDPLHRLWAQRAPMLVARAMFACCALDGKIIVAGGLTNCRKSISAAEIYDPEADTWESLPDLRQAHPSACSGLVIKDKMHVLHKGISTVQILEDGRNYWAVEDYHWLQGPMAMVCGELYVLSNSCIMKQHGENIFDKMVPCASGFQSRIAFGMIGLGESIYLFGGVIGPGPRNQCIKPLSDVDILNVTSERPTWRQGSPMTRCRGSIAGCALLKI